MADDDSADSSANPASADCWYIAREGQPHGPVKWRDLAELLRTGHVSAADFVWREGLENWVPLGSLAEAATARPTAPPMPACPSPPPPPPPAPGEASAPRHGTPRSAASIGKSRGPAGQGRLLVAILVASMMAAGALGWSLHRLSLAKVQTAEAASDRSSSRAPAVARHDNIRGSSNVHEQVDESLRNAAPPRDIASRPADEWPAASAAAATSAEDGPSGRVSEPKTPRPPLPTDIKPPEETRPPPPKTPTEATKPAGRRTLYQEVLISRRPTFDVSGITVSQDLRYRVVSKLLSARARPTARSRSTRSSTTRSWRRATTSRRPLSRNR